MTRRTPTVRSCAESRVPASLGPKDKPAPLVDALILASMKKPPTRLTDVELASEIDWHEDRLRELRQQLKAREGGRASGLVRAIRRKFDVKEILATYAAHGGYGAHKHTCATHGCSAATLTRYLKLPRPSGS